MKLPIIIAGDKPVLPPDVHRYGVESNSSMFEVLDNVLTPGECNALIKRMSPALRNVSTILSRVHPDGSKRLSKTDYNLSVMEHPQFANLIWNRIMDSPGASAIYNYVDREACGFPIGLAPRLRMLQYDGKKGNRFDPHYDRIVPDEKTGSESLITVLIYLNTGDGQDFSGGETLYLNPNDPLGPDGKDVVKVLPKIGRVVLFEHCLFHAGAPLIVPTSEEIVSNESKIERIGQPNCKYVMRTDILFPIQEKNKDKYEC